MNHPYPLSRSLIAGLVTASLLAGCASPYVTLERRPNGKNETALPKALAAAIDEAQSVQDQYRNKVIELGEAERLASNSLIGLGTLILGMAAAKTHSSAITGTALVAGSVYTFGTFNNDKRRAMIYIAGMKALECAEGAVTPLVLGAGQENRLSAGRRTIEEQTGKLALALGEAEGWAARARAADPAKFKDGIEAVAQASAAAQAAVGKADEAVDLAGQRLSKPYQLAQELLRTTRAIDRAVLDEIRGTENALQAVPGIVAGIQGNAGLFSVQTLAPSLTAATTSVPDDKTRPQAGQVARPATVDVAQRDHEIVAGFSKALGALRGETVVLASMAARLSRDAAVSVVQTASDTLKACQVEATVKPISVSPATVTFTAKQALTQSVLVDGGNGNYTAGFLQTPTPGLVPTVRPRSKGVVDIVASDQTVAGQSYQLVIEDTTQQSRQIVTVVVATSGTGTTPTVNAMATADNVEKAIAAVVAAKELKLSDNRVVTIVQVTRRGNGIEVIYRIKNDATVTSDEVAAAVRTIGDVIALLGVGPELVVATPAPKPQAGHVSKFGSFTATLKTADVKALQIRLCVPADGTWGPKSQEALKVDRQRLSSTDPKRPAPGDPLTEAEARRYLALSESDALARCRATGR